MEDEKKMLEKYMAKAKEAGKTNTKAWLSNITELKDVARERRGSFEKLPRLDCRELDGSEEDPEILKVKFLSDPKSIKTEKMQRAMDVLNVEVLLSSKKDIQPDKYSIWLNTTVLRNEVHRFKDDTENKSLIGKNALIASYGKQKNKKGQDVYIFRVIPTED